MFSTAIFSSRERNEVRPLAHDIGATDFALAGHRRRLPGS